MEMWSLRYLFLTKFAYGGGDRQARAYDGSCYVDQDGIWSQIPIL